MKQPLYILSLAVICLGILSCRCKYYDRQNLKSDLAQYFAENEDKIEALRGWSIRYEWERTRWYCTYVPDSFCAILDWAGPETLEGYYIEKLNGCDSIAMLDSILRQVYTLHDIRQLAHAPFIGTFDPSIVRLQWPFDYSIVISYEPEENSLVGDRYQIVSVQPNCDFPLEYNYSDGTKFYVEESDSLYRNWFLRKQEMIK